MEKFVVTLYGFNGKLIERIGGFTSKPEAERYAAREFMRSDVGSIHVGNDVTRPQGNGRYR